jgi:hypothetical protein
MSARKSSPGVISVTNGTASLAIKTNSKGYTNLLVSIHIDDRHRLVEASQLTGPSQQSLIRSAISQLLDNTLAAPAPKTRTRTTKTNKAVQV